VLAVSDEKITSALTELESSLSNRGVTLVVKEDEVMLGSHPSLSSLIEKLMKEDGYKVLNMELQVKTKNGLTVTTTRCPIRVDGQILISGIGAPLLGEHNEQVEKDFLI
jgi:crotonobetainyl-CoA:carnitine CoA-transferase CaiB-like acyl-CoA transferase